MENKKKVVVFGATGRVGKHVVDYLARKGWLLIELILKVIVSCMLLLEILAS